MQRLNEKWLKLINYYIVITAFLFFVIYSYFAIQQNTFFVTGKDSFGASFFGYVIAVVLLVYSFTLRRIIRRSNVWIAYAISIVMYAVLNSALVEVALYSDGMIIFLANNFIVLFMATSLGYVATLFGMAIGLIVYVMTLAGNTDPSPLGVAGDGISVMIRTILTFCLLYLVKGKYEIEGVNNDNYIERYFVRSEVVKLLTDSIGDGVLIVDKEGIIRSVNPKTSVIIQQDSEDIIGLGYESVLKLKDAQGLDIEKEKNPIEAALKSKESIVQEVIIEQGVEEQKYIDINVSSIANRITKEIYGAVIILRDVSAKKREEAARTEFISTASHEMRTPVAAIEGYLALAMNPSVGNMDDKPLEFLKKAHESTEHLGRLFQDLLISSNADDGRLVNHPKHVELGKFLEEQVEIYSKLLLEKESFNIKMVIGSEGVTGSSNRVRPLYYANVDPDRIKEAVSNLIENAIKYGNSSDIEVGITGDSNVIQIYIKDSGIGISKEEISHLFQKFYRVDSSSTRTTGGTGLGLFICRKIIELYGGKIWVESERNVGSTFFINLPRLSNDKVEDIRTEDEDKNNS